MQMLWVKFVRLVLAGYLGILKLVLKKRDGLRPGSRHARRPITQPTLLDPLCYFDGVHVYETLIFLFQALDMLHTSRVSPSRLVQGILMVFRARKAIRLDAVQTF